VKVRVLAERSLSLPTAGSAQYIPGDVLELPADDAKQFVTDGFVQRVK
jgi:hypothetical protein